MPLSGVSVSPLRSMGLPLYLRFLVPIPVLVSEAPSNGTKRAANDGADTSAVKIGIFIDTIKCQDHTMGSDMPPKYVSSKK